MLKKLGYFRKNKSSNKRLIDLFEQNQKLRFGSPNKVWENKNFVNKLETSENHAREDVLKLLKVGKIKSADDFYRAAFLFQHGNSYQDYSMAVTFAAISMLLGESWAKNFFAKTIDRFLLSVNRPQIFFTQYDLKKGKWILANYEKVLSKEALAMFDAESLKKARAGEKKLNKEG